MWRREARGSWVKTSTKMSDSGDEYRDVSEGLFFQVGDSVIAYTYPLTEGLIIERKVGEDGKLVLTLLSAPHKKKGKKWSGAKVSLRDAARLSKKPPAKFIFPIKGIERLRAEARQAKADPVWVAAVKSALDKDFQQRDLSSDESEQDIEADEEDDSDALERLSELQPKETEECKTRSKFRELEKRIGEVLKLKHVKEKIKAKKKDSADDDSDYEQWKKWKKEQKNKKRKQSKRRRKKSSSSESSSSSSSSSSGEELLIGEVGEGSSGIYTCPFYKSDSRGFKNVKRQIQGQAITRRQIRIALYNLYSNFDTLTSFADKFVSKANATPYRPFAMDVAWFQATAECIDEMMLNSLHGAWTLWNEPVVDQMFTGFLELLMRISPYKEYPVCLDDAVRKWMKKKRIGTNTKFGPVPYGMQHAKFTEGGVVMHQSSGQRQKERTTTVTKQGNTNATPPSRGGKKGPPPPVNNLIPQLIPSSLNCLVCKGRNSETGCKFPLPLVLGQQVTTSKIKSRKNKRRWAIRFNNLNQRIQGLNVLWGGWNSAQRNISGIHWECAELKLQFLYRKILRWPSKLLTVPKSMSSFATVIGKKGIPYRDEEVGMIEVHEVKVDSVALPTDPPDIIPILSILPEVWKQKYEREENVVVEDQESWDRMRNCKPRLGMRKEEYVKIIHRLLKLRMVKLLPIEQVYVVNGLHCVSKGNGKQRLIFDGRPVNMVLQTPEKLCLPDFSLVAEWEVKEGEVVRFGKLDLDNFYHRLGVPGWMIRYLGLPKVAACQFGGKEGFLSPVCCTLPMGLSHSVLLAQVAHLFVLRNVSISPAINLKVNKYAQSWMLLYIDDVIIAAKAELQEVAKEMVNKLIRECLQCYQEAALIINQSKLTWAASEIGGLGCVLSEKHCGIHPKEERMRQVIGATRHILTVDRLPKKHIECLLGNWVWFVLLFRPLYSVFFYVYKWLHMNNENDFRCLWESVKREFRIIILFADICKLSWKREIATEVLAMDASLTGAGACERNWCALQNQDDLGQQLFLKEPNAWKVVLNRPWDHSEHINILEMRALLLSLLPRVAAVQHFGLRWKIFSDSSVVVGAVRKGRSSSYMLCCLLRRLVAVCMTMNASLVIDWVPSELNPADVFSRVFSPREMS